MEAMKVSTAHRNLGADRGFSNIMGGTAPKPSLSAFPEAQPCL